MYSLQKYAGPSSRHVCPACGRPHCFTYYVDEQGNELDPTVGKCDHDSSCHYHKTPAEFFRENPDKRPGPDWRYQKVDWLEAKKQKMKVLPVATCFIPPDIVLRSVRPQVESDFTTFLLSIFDPVVVEDLVNDYQLGVTSKRDVIFFQLDLNGSCRTGKIMKYDPETGHRIKDENQPNRINWVHSLMKQGGRLPADWQLTQCLFGEHLLKQYPNKVVALVESEKTAVICAGLMPRFLWLATGGKSQINDRLLVLKGRKVVAFPDVDGYDEWLRKLAEYPELGVTVSPVLQQNATAADREAHIDIADWLLRYMFGPPPEEFDKWHLEFLKAAEFISPEHHAEVEAMIHDLELEFLGAIKFEPPPEDASTDTESKKKTE
jgi:hypothetical protein